MNSPMKKSPAFYGTLFALLLLSAGATWTAFRWDTPIRAAIVESQGKKWNKTDDYKFHAAVRKYGDWPWLMLAGGVALGGAVAMRSREWQRILIAAMLASTLAGILVNASRLTTGRTRPRESPKIEQGFYGPFHEGRFTIGRPGFNSFPSGHTATAFGFAGVVLFACPWIGLGTLILAALVAWSSILIGAHHPSDVVVSIIISLTVAWFVWRWVHRNGDHAARAIGHKLRSFRRN